MDAGTAAVLGAAIGGLIGLISVFAQASIQNKAKTKEKLELAYVELLSGVIKAMINSTDEKLELPQKDMELLLLGFSKLQIYAPDERQKELREILNTLTKYDSQSLYKVRGMLVAAAKKDLIKTPVKFTEPLEGKE